ncbi:putative sugar phosphate isomerase YwlF [bioreactor metagenome]|uniref:Putative sugar phosphate isomerase YwlF n=1 Tax=bioreactor metagenome TaxID=1076179 RepID=A0A645FC92_9ZZZZ
MTREHNDTNVLALGANVTTTVRAQGIVDIWLNEPFFHGERHQRRIDKISIYEKTH